MVVQGILSHVCKCWRPIPLPPPAKCMAAGWSKGGWWPHVFFTHRVAMCLNSGGPFRPQHWRRDRWHLHDWSRRRQEPSDPLWRKTRPDVFIVSCASRRSARSPVLLQRRRLVQGRRLQRNARGVVTAIGRAISTWWWSMCDAGWLLSIHFSAKVLCGVHHAARVGFPASVYQLLNDHHGRTTPAEQTQFWLRALRLCQREAFAMCFARGHFPPRREAQLQIFQGGQVARRSWVRLLVFIHNGACLASHIRCCQGVARASASQVTGTCPYH